MPDDKEELSQELIHLTKNLDYHKLNEKSNTTDVEVFQLYMTEVKDLLERGADINASLNEGNFGTPIHYAVCHGNKDIVRFLIENGADINRCNAQKTTPLHYAVLYGDMGMYGNSDGVGIIKTLIDAGADVNAQDTQGKTALGWAKQYAEESRQPESKYEVYGRLLEAYSEKVKIEGSLQDSQSIKAGRKQKI
ncbi:MAG TPA: ankyrin repeat domain-containing protein [Anaerovoracaceae bacterium]|nr:ankyrin repeat domain-containing protein [Anaerovoracaceae bacterium]